MKVERFAVNHFFGGLKPVDGILTKKVYAASRVKIEARSLSVHIRNYLDTKPKSLTRKLRYDIPRNIYSQNLWFKG